MTRRLQVYVDEDDLGRLDVFARARGWTRSRAIRAAIRALTQRSGDDPLLDLSGDVGGLPPDLSENFNRYADETFDAGRRRGR